MLLVHLSMLLMDQQNDDYTIAEITINGKKLVIAQSNKIFNKGTKHMAKGINWTGSLQFCTIINF